MWNNKNSIEDMIIFEDKDILVCHKAAGIAVQNARIGAADMESSLKNYLALKNTETVPEKRQGRLEDYLIKNGRTNTSEVVTSKTSGAKKAVLDYEVIHQISDARTESGKRILIKIHLETGRHHQIRVQMAHAGMPLLGDRKYNPGEISQLPLGLCSCHLIFRHPITGKKMEFQVTPNGESFAGFPNP